MAVSVNHISFILKPSLLNISNQQVSAGFNNLKYSVCSTSLPESCAAGRETGDLSKKNQTSYVSSRCKIHPQRVPALSPDP